MEYALTEIDVELIRGLAEGLTIDAIGSRVNLTRDSAKHALTRIRRRWGCTNNAHLVAQAYEKDVLHRTDLQQKRIRELMRALDVAYRNARMIGGYK